MTAPVSVSGNRLACRIRLGPEPPERCFMNGDRDSERSAIMPRTAWLPLIVVFCATGLLPGEPTGDVKKVVDRYRSIRPDDRDLTTFQLDWAPTLKEAKEKAAKEGRPIFLIVVTNSYGNMY